MSGTGSKINEYQWLQAPTTTLESAAPTQPQSEDVTSVGHSQIEESAPTGEVQHARPPLRSHKSFPYSLGPSSRLQDENPQDQSSTNALGDFTERVLSQGPQPTGSSNLQQPTFGGSAPTSPAGRLTPNSPKVEDNDLLMEDEEIDFGTAEQEEGTERPPMTAAELRAHKRKMKRFRLTHNQTRFLMSEFARQAHPDAAHRERLSREIPGLSPRQVQVWFQNRRAKLKRLTTDDRERIMRSRALPADFDMTQALHAPFGAPTPSMSTPAATSSGTFAPFGSSSGLRPLTLDILNRGSEYTPYSQHFTNQSGVTPALGAFAFTPPQSATDTMSPGSAASNMSPFSFQTQESPKRHPFGGAVGHQTGYAAHGSQMPRLHIHDRITRPTGEIAASPLRTSMSYSGLGSSNTPQNQTERTNSFSEHSSYTHERPRPLRSVTNPNMGNSGPYGLGFSYANMPNYQQVDQSKQVPVTSGSQQTVDFTRYRRSSSHLAGPPISYAQYPSASFSAPQMPQYSHFGAGYVAQSFQSPYQPAPEPQHQQEEGQQQISQHSQHSYTPIASQPHQFLPIAPSQQEEPGDNSDGGVPVHPPY